MESDKQILKSKSPFKTKKYKAFLTSLLSPSASKKPIQRKESAKFPSSLSIEDESLYKKNTSLENSHHSNESIYSSIDSLKELPVPRFHPQVEDSKLDKLNIRSQITNAQPNYEKPNLESDVLKPQIGKDHLSFEKTILKSDQTNPKEPLYSTIQKKQLHLPESQSESLKVQELKEDNKMLQGRIKDLAEDNRLFKKKLQEFVKEEKWKEEILHAKLQLKITELEAETRKEVKSLSDRIQILIREKESLNGQIDILQVEKKSLQASLDDLFSKIKLMVSPDLHNKVITEHQNQLKDMKKKHTEEIDRIRELYNETLDSKNSLENCAQELQKQIKVLERKIETLGKKNEEIGEEKNNLLEQADESKHMEQDMQTLLLSLLKMTETIATERNVLLNKTSFQDSQQKEIQSTVIDYSLNIGRLQEHIVNLNKGNHQELIKLKANKYHHGEHLQKLYSKQLDALREKVVAQHNYIKDLESDKRKLESQLELIWQAACGTNSKLMDDVKAILHMHSVKEPR